MVYKFYNRNNYVKCALLDIDECIEDNDGCAQTCTNNNGSFLCSCIIGYTLAADDIGCDGRLRS